MVAAPSLESTFQRRYLAKLSTNLAGLALNFVNISVLPRALGPVTYGGFEFLTAFFQNVSASTDMGTSSALFTKLSRRNQDAGLLRFYLWYALFVALAFVLLVSAVGVVGGRARVWPGLSWRYILLAAALGYLLWLSEVARKVIDAFGLTVSGELVVLGFRAAGALVVLGLFFGGWLNLTALFVKELALAGALMAGMVWLARRHWGEHLRERAMRTPGEQVRREFWAYSSPLIMYSLAGVAAGLADRWLLQTFAGSEEQGFYGLAYRLSAVSLIFSVAMTQLLQREFSRAHGQADLASMQQLFRRYVPLLYVITAYFAVFISAQAGTVVSLMGGDAYAAAVPAAMVMALFPIHQTYGQLSGSVFYATDQTALYRNIGVLSMLIGLAMTWFILAPHEYGGLGAGSRGLAAKMVIAQFLGVNLQLWFNLKHLRLNFRWYFAHQVLVVSLFLGLAWTSVALVNAAGWPSLPSFIASGALYSVLVAAICFQWPEISGLARHDVARVAAWAGMVRRP